MTTTLLPAEIKRRPRLGMQSIAQKLVFSQLERLHTGYLVVADENGRELKSFGKPVLPDDHLYAELRVKDPSCFVDIMCAGSIGAAEAYMSGDWDTPDLTRIIRVMARNKDIVDQMEGGLANLTRPFLKVFHKLNQNTEKGSKRNIAAHYDLGNDFFQLFLDPTMMYSSGIFPAEDSSMKEASLNKLKTICEKLKLSERDKVIEIGTGWGGFAVYAAKHYGCHVTTTTISEEQYAMAKARVEEEGLQDKVTLLKKDYRQLEGSYDKLVSIEMIEAVGWQFFETFYETCSRLLKPEGLMLIQAITIEDQRYESARKSVDFIQRYIFPGSCIPSVQALSTASMKASDLRLVQMQDYAEHYARTLKAWHDEFNAKEEEIKALGYSEEFMRMWRFYLSYCEGGFAERSIGVAHLVYAKPACRIEPGL